MVLGTDDVDLDGYTFNAISNVLPECSPLMPNSEHLQLSNNHRSPATEVSLLSLLNLCSVLIPCRGFRQDCILIFIP